jgi:hypothetical protein
VLQAIDRPNEKFALFRPDGGHGGRLVAYRLFASPQQILPAEVKAEGKFQ